MEEKNKVGRPEEYTEELGNYICGEIVKGKSLKSICEREKMPCRDTVFMWLSRHTEFADNYARATEQRTEAQLEELNKLGEESIEEARQADPKSSNAIVQAYKLKADNMKWVMARMKPKKYGDKLDMTSDGKAVAVNIISYADKKE